MKVDLNLPEQSKDDELISVWQQHWITRRDLKRRQPGFLSSDKGDVPYMTAERLASLVEEARKAGYAQGVQAGRVDLRERIEAGEVPGLEKR